ncbi:hypothetical protein KHX94_00105 [Shewanella dokdonensis]|uniref:N-acetyltransferase domain-containing protein n=1 Tax=Shewanella dokdonensis TaxID=712036 RepID=A0ABX8DGE3_9GAMM|nr:hypothetical protein [Shewanella dokdonensis]QVK23286.1 hypothetical protein KHX94_00105 [Shewanella dokdonensis]
MPSLISSSYSKTLDNDPHDYAELLRQQGIVVGADIGDPIFVQFSLLEVLAGTGYVVFTEMIPADIDHAELLCTDAFNNNQDPFDIYTSVGPKVYLRTGNRFGQIFFAITPPLNGPQISGVFVEDDFQKYGISSLAYRFLASHYGAVYSDKNQTIFGARLWYAGLPKHGIVRALDTNANNAVLETFVVNQAPSRSTGMLLN